MKTIVKSMLLLLFLVILKSNAQCVSPPIDMVSWWTGDNNTLDIIGTNDGTQQNGVGYASGMVNNAFLFDGIDDLVFVPHSADLDLTGDMTLMVWVRRIGYANDHQTVLCKGAGYIPNDEPAVFAMRFEFDVTEFLFEDINGNNLILGGPAFEDSMYHHYVYVRSGNTHSLYVDDFLFDSQTFASSPASTVGLPLTIGAQYHNPTSSPNDYSLHFNGEVDELMVFNRALTETEISNVYNAGTSGVCKDGLSVNNYTLENFSVYPNPTSDYVTFKLNEQLIAENKEVNLLVFDLKGQKIFEESDLKIKTHVDISSLPQGVYMYALNNGISILKSGQLIKN